MAAPPPTQTTVDIAHTRAAGFGTYFATGAVVGGSVAVGVPTAPSSVNKIHILWYLDTFSNVVEHLVIGPQDPASGAAPIITQSADTPLVREDQCKIIIDLDTATQLHAILGERLKQIGQLQTLPQ